MLRGPLKILYFICLLNLFICANSLSEVTLFKKVSGTQKDVNSENIDKESDNIDYILGPGDKIEITVYRHDELKKNLLIGPSGKIMFPLLGDIQAAGLTIFELREEVTKGLLKYIKEPKVDVNLVSIKSQTITVLGEIVKPGYYSFTPPITVLEAISMAGGFTDKANQNNVLIIKKGLDKPILKTLNLKKALKEGDLTKNITLQTGDIICVPESFF